MAELKRRSKPSTIFPPALVFLFAVLAGVGLNYEGIMPLPIDAGNVIRQATGVGFFVGGTLLWILAWREFRKHGESFGHRYSTQTVITTGPYRITRHPAYIGYATMALGFGLIRDNLWVVVLVPFAWAYVYTAARREERYLMSKFEEIYTRYRMQVRRWF